jgi:hypothetical protein
VRKKLSPHGECIYCIHDVTEVRNDKLMWFIKYYKAIVYIMLLVWQPAVLVVVAVILRVVYTGELWRFLAFKYPNIPSKNMQTWMCYTERFHKCICVKSHLRVKRPGGPCRIVGITIPKIRMCFQKWNCAASFPISTFMYLWEILYSPDRSAYLAAAKKPGNI